MRRGSAAGRRSRVPEARPGDPDKTPAVAGGAQRQREDAVAAVPADDAVADRHAERAQLDATCANDEFAHPGSRGGPVRVLPCEPLVVVLVARDDHVGARAIERSPGPGHGPIVAMLPG